MSLTSASLASSCFYRHLLVLLTWKSISSSQSQRKIQITSFSESRKYQIASAIETSRMDNNTINPAALMPKQNFQITLQSVVEGQNMIGNHL
jgi:hypothetical protein